jgi:hypothetical protein
MDTRSLPLYSSRPAVVDDIVGFRVSGTRAPRGGGRRVRAAGDVDPRRVLGRPALEFGREAEHALAGVVEMTVVASPRTTGRAQALTRAARHDGWGLDRRYCRIFQGRPRDRHGLLSDPGSRRRAPLEPGGPIPPARRLVQYNERAVSRLLEKRAFLRRGRRRREVTVRGRLHRFAPDRGPTSVRPEAGLLSPRTPSPFLAGAHRVTTGESSSETRLSEAGLIHGLEGRGADDDLECTTILVCNGSRRAPVWPSAAPGLAAERTRWAGVGCPLSRRGATSRSRRARRAGRALFLTGTLHELREGGIRCARRRSLPP